MNFAETFPHQVVISDDKPALYADISDAEFYAIGKITASWAILEHSMMYAAITLATKHKPPPTKGFAALPIVRKLLKFVMPAPRPAAIPHNYPTLPFERRLRVFGSVIASIPIGPARTRLENIASRIANVQAERHDFTHGIWDWAASTPTKITVDHVRKNGRRRHKHYDSEAMLKLAERVAQINFELCYPQGLEQFYEAKAQAGGYMSRRFIIDVSGIETRDPTLRLANVLPPPEIREALDRLISGVWRGVERPDLVDHGFRFNR
jgi:hypothetical protein